ncbi:MAG: RNA polymerase sigma factor [Polyangiales bacterium]
MAPAHTMFDPSKALADVRFREALVAAVRRRVPPHEVEEIVQATLTEALASSSRPDQEEAMRRWVFGIARNKVVDFHRRRSREVVPEDAASLADAAPAESAPHDAIDLLRWAEREMPETDTSARTLEWMLREGAGEKLEEIARDEEVPAPAVRQRVARMRKHFRTRWAALAAAAIVGSLVAFFLLRGREPDIAKNPPIAPDPIARGKVIRHEALDGACKQQLWDACIRQLDEAAKLDPAGDTGEDVKSVRDAAEKAKAPPPAPSPSPAPSPAPSPTTSEVAPKIVPKPMPTSTAKKSEQFFDEGGAKKAPSKPKGKSMK